MRKTIIVALALLLLAPAGASAARPPITQERADRAAVREVEYTYGLLDDFYDPGLPLGNYQISFEDGTTTWEYNADPVRYEIDPCEVVGRYKAECVATIWMSDDLGCDQNVTVSTTRRGKLITDSELSCDGWRDEGSLSFS